MCDYIRPVAARRPTQSKASRARKEPWTRPPALKKEESLRIRVTSEQKRTFEEAAHRAGLSVSSWLVSVALREAKSTP